MASKGANNVYLNLAAINNADEAKPLTFRENFTGPLLHDPSRYVLSIVRWSLDGTSLPFMLYEDGLFSVAISLGPSTTAANTALAPFVWSFPLAPYPFPPRGIYRYGDWIILLNNAIAAAWADLSSRVAVPPGSKAPYAIFSTQTQQISFYFDANWLEGVPAANRLFLYVGRNVYYCLNNVLARINQTPLSPAAGFFALLPQDIYGSNSAPLDPAVPPGEYRLTQEYADPQALSRGWGVRTVSFISYLMGTRAELTTLQNEGPNLISQGGAGSGIPQTGVVTDFNVQGLAGAAGYRTDLVYLPTAEYRLTDLTNSVPLMAVDIQVTYQDQQGRSYPYLIQRGAASTIKMAFISKDSRGIWPADEGC